jgi:vault protein inter-alpha-trypsin-like protein
MTVSSSASPPNVRTEHTPGAPSFIFGVAFPAAVVVLELASRMCAATFFDTMPTFWHVLAVCAVPASNLLLWIHLRDDTPWSAKWLAFANGGAIAIAGFYALLFLPLMPLAVVALAFGIGVLPFAPLVSLAAALLLRRDFRAKHPDRRSRGPLLAGLTTGIALLLALDIQSAATRIGIEWAASSVPTQRERGLTLLRTIGDDDLLLRLCYDTAGRPTGLLSALVLLGETVWLHPQQRQIAQSPAEVREIYYRVHGVPFNAKPAPFENGKWSRFADFQVDDDHGGSQVGGRLRGLHLVSSRIDGSVTGDDAVAYLEWTFEFRNSEPVDREVRLQLALPPGGVVSRATLWVNGEEREAAYGGRNEVRAAYQRVAVQQRRDPLLVTTKGSDRVMVQAFPVPRNGVTIKLKIGITAPLEITDPARARVSLPAIVDRNFSFATGISHGVWIESRQALAASVPGLALSRPDARLFRIVGAIGDDQLSRTRRAITVDRNPAIDRLAARIGEDEPVVQEIVPGAPQAISALMLVIDGSARLAGTAAQLIEALDAIRSGVKVGAIIASEPTQMVPLAPWSDAQKQAVVKLLRSASFYGGQDNAPALVEAMRMLEAEPDAALLWVHGPQPVAFRGSAAGLEQATSRLSRLPDVMLYAVEPGPNELLPDAPWAWSARSLPTTGSLQADLAGVFTRASGQARSLAVRRTQEKAADGIAKGSEHIVRLWAHDRVLDLMRTNPAGNRTAAVALATKYHLVTPVSGAVVLETRQQYDESRLTPATQAMVPTVPEPHEWVLALIACAALLWLVRQTRQRPLAAA